MLQMMLYILALWWFPVLTILIIANLLFLWTLHWIVWLFGEEDVDVNHFRRMK